MKWFPNAKCLEAPDANRDKIINKQDAQDILTYYAEKASSQFSEGYLNIGKIDIYEWYTA